MSRSPLLGCQAVSKAYGARSLFDELSFALFEGDRAGFVGPNGAGKSTLPRGVHGCPATTPTLCLATGGHPGIAALREAFAREAPTSATLARLLARAVELPWRPGVAG